MVSRRDLFSLCREVGNSDVLTPHKKNCHMHKVSGLQKSISGDSCLAWCVIGATTYTTYILDNLHGGELNYNWPGRLYARDM